MIKHILLAGILLISALVVAQKKEIKKAEKALNNGDLTEAIGLLNEAERLISNADNKLKTQFYVVKGEVYLADAGKHNFEKMKNQPPKLKSSRVNIQHPIEYHLSHTSLICF